MPKKILLVDDEEAMLGTLKPVLVQRGYEVATAADGEEALRVAASERPDLVVTDLNMPKMDGWRFCQKLKAESGFEDVPFIMLSALVEDAQTVTNGELGDCYLSKPFSVAVLLERIEVLLKSRE